VPGQTAEEAAITERTEAALIPDQKIRFIANAKINTLAVCDVSVRGN